MKKKDLKKKLTRAPTGISTFKGDLTIPTPRTPLPQMVPPSSRGTLSRLLSNATVKTVAKRTEESNTLDPQWLHQSLPSCNPSYNAAWKDNHIPLLECPPN